jgi:hypothetical protein
LATSWPRKPASTSDRQALRAAEGESTPIPVKLDLSEDIDVVLAACRDETAPLSTEQLRGRVEGQAGEPV